MINPDKSLILITHPRSGSTWFQDKLTQFNLWELFNLGIKWNHTPDRPLLISTSNQINVNEIPNRIQAFYNYQSTKGPVSAKIHLNQLHDGLVEFIQKNDFELVDLRRKDVKAILVSYVIATVTKEWVGKIRTHTITINKEDFDIAVGGLVSSKKNNILMHELFPHIKTFYYEDCLSWEPSDWWKSSSRILKQNAKSITTITNVDELDGWINDVNWSELFPPDHLGLTNNV